MQAFIDLSEFEANLLENILIPQHHASGLAVLTMMIWTVVSTSLTPWRNSGWLLPAIRLPLTHDFIMDHLCHCAFFFFRPEFPQGKDKPLTVLVPMAGGECQKPVVSAYINRKLK